MWVDAPVVTDFRIGKFWVVSASPASFGVGALGPGVDAEAPVAEDGVAADDVAVAALGQADADRVSRDDVSVAGVRSADDGEADAGNADARRPSRRSCPSGRCRPCFPARRRCRRWRWRTAVISVDDVVEEQITGRRVIDDPGRVGQRDGPRPIGPDQIVLDHEIRCALVADNQGVVGGTEQVSVRRIRPADDHAVVRKARQARVALVRGDAVRLDAEEAAGDVRAGARHANRWRCSRTRKRRCRARLWCP